MIPIEVKYQSQQTIVGDIHGLSDFCRKNEAIQHGYAMTKAPQDIRLLSVDRCAATKILRLFCYWLGNFTKSILKQLISS